MEDSFKKSIGVIAIFKRLNDLYLKMMHKFGIEMHKSVDEALPLDKNNANTLWSDIISKEGDYVRPSFKIM